MKSSRFFIRDLVLGALLCMAAPGVLAGGPVSRPLGATTRATTRPAVDEVRERVIAFLSERVRRDPEDTVALNRLAGEYLGRYRQSGDDGDLLKSQAMAEQSLKSVPESENPGGLAARARARFALHHFAEAREIGLRLVAFEPDKRYPLEILGDAELELGDYDAAEATYRKVESMGEADVNSETRLARLALVRGRRDEARERFAKSVAMARTSCRLRRRWLRGAWCRGGNWRLAPATGRARRSNTWRH